MYRERPGEFATVDGLNRRGLVARLGVVGDEALEEPLHCGRTTLPSALGSLPLRTSANQSRAMARDWSTVTSPKRPMAGVRRWPLLARHSHHEDLAASRRDLEQETRYRCVAEFVRILLWLNGVDDGLRESESWRSYPLTRPDFRC
jgi:hypothetical protein